MAIRDKSIQVLSEEYVIDLLRTCCEDPDVMEIAVLHLKDSYLPDRDSVGVWRNMKRIFTRERGKIERSILQQNVMGNNGMMKLVTSLYDGKRLSNEVLLATLEEFIKSVELKRVLHDMNSHYPSDMDKCITTLIDHAEWQKEFTLMPTDFRDPVHEFASHYESIKDRINTPKQVLKPVCRFYIDELDSRNEGQSLRTKLTCFMASTGVGKSHILRYIGRNTCYMDGLDVLHIQLEGDDDETLEAYAAAMAGCSLKKYRKAGFLEGEFKRHTDTVSKAAGTIKIKTVTKLGSRFSTRDIRSIMAEYTKAYKRKPDVLLIDSMDLINDAPLLRGKDEERHVRVAVSQELKNIAKEENIWVCVSYQATINDPQWVNDERNVLTEYNCSEAKGIARALDHLITLNRSANENQEQTMRIYPAKCRDFHNNGAFKIATDYSHEIFYDRPRTMALIDNGT